MKSVNRTRIMNISRILHEIWIAGKTTRIDIARSCGLNKSTVTHIIDDMLSLGIVLEGSEGVSSPKGGRKPVKIFLNRSYGYVLGFELRPESYTVVAVDLHGDILFTKTDEDIEFNGINLKTIFLNKCQEILLELSWLTSPLLGIGVGMSGIIDSENRIIKGSIPLGISEPYDFYEEICSHFNVPVFIENDANCGAWGELVFHRSSSPKNFIFVLVEFWKQNNTQNGMLRPAIGLGIVMNGTVYRGKDGSAGEFKSVFSSHNKLNHQIEAVAELKNIMDVTKNPDILESFLKELSKNLALLVNTFNLDQIYFGGDTDICRHKLPIFINDSIDNNWVYSTKVNCDIHFSSMGKNIISYGAAGLVLDKLFIDLETLNSLDHERRNDFYLLQNELFPQPMKEMEIASFS